MGVFVCKVVCICKMGVFVYKVECVYTASQPCVYSSMRASVTTNARVQEENRRTT